MTQLTVPVNEHDHMLGKPDARVVLVEYADYQCPYCGDAYPIVKQVAQEFAGQVCVVFRNFPLVQAHPEALPAAMVAEFAAQHGNFWEVHDALFENQRQLGIPLYAKILAKLNLSAQELEAALSNPATEQRIRSDIESGERSGVDGTPAFFINGKKFSPRDGFNDVLNTVRQLMKPS